MSKLDKVLKVFTGDIVNKERERENERSTECSDSGGKGHEDESTRERNGARRR